MSNTVNEVITVERVNQYGVRAGDKQYNFSKKLPQSEVAKFEVDKTYTVNVYTSDSGAKYINSLVQSVQPTVPDNNTKQLPPPTVERQKVNLVFPPTRDFDKEARGKTRCVAMCAAVQSPALATLSMGIEEFKQAALQVADLIVAYTFQEQNELDRKA